MALLVADTMTAVVAAPTSSRMARPPSAKERVMVRICACQRRWSSSVTSLNSRFKVERSCVEVGRIGAIELDGDDARDRQRIERVGLSQPRLEQLRGIAHAQRTRIDDARLLRQEARDVADELVDVGAVLHLDLHRDLAGDVAQPGRGGLVHHVDRAGRQAGEEAHDGDHQRQRAAGDGAGRHDRRVGLSRLVAAGAGRALAPPAGRAAGRVCSCVPRPCVTVAGPVRSR